MYRESDLSISISKGKAKAATCVGPSSSGEI